MIDLRSDTVTRPTPAMLEVMMQAEVGDDVFGEDPTVQRLEKKTARIFGMEAGLFCPSGTMTNQIAIRVQTQPQQEVICDRNAHVYLYEGGGLAYNSMVSVRLLSGERGILSAEMVEANINPDDIHFPPTSLVALENTMNKGGGACYPLNQIELIANVCQKHSLALHLDGARVFNALVATGDNPAEYGKHFTSISVCLSKGLGAPVGSVLVGSRELIKQARRVRKVLGGGMRQAGYLAAAGIYALDHHIGRLAEDHRRAKLLAEALQAHSYVDSVLPVETNIVIATLRDVDPAQFLAQLEAQGVRAVPFGKKDVRFVTHLDFSDEQLGAVADVLKKVNRQSA
ncbi:threonine aldolase family protein [Tunicatimonas pelagia]|uniref:threonine aldolase family protein n=1 Tax=Tunicatimonas pelagia TaxID=931531 RepID=UPI0026663A7A|nr:GntG family PLP-dependent aldolase [Tunicatimonas pelagia]WKN40549.1 GntG family PLP-dependent aldolase [Tunicatimonas pelagia]